MKGCGIGRRFLKSTGRRIKVTKKRSFSTAFATAVVVGVGGMWIFASPSEAQNYGRNDGDEARMIQGFAIAPVPLNLAGKDLKLVGLGSYFVNAQGDCNGCHSAGPPTQYTPNGNPYQLSPPFSGTKQINPATYLGGGRNFGPLIAGSASIISRNLTPDKTGMPAGGRTWEQFLEIFRTGVDLDNLHPNCPAGTVAINCIPAPFNGSLLQVMSWPTFQNMSDRDLRAVYEYLSAIPCIEGPADPTNPLHNDCN
jgi:hypothetical protein